MPNFKAQYKHTYIGIFPFSICTQLMSHIYTFVEINDVIR